MPATKLFQAAEFADLAGVTVRALHHYDRLGLLKPARRSAAGYRLYSEADLPRLEQIVVLKFLGLQLTEIRDLLKRDKQPLEQVLRRQRFVLGEKRRQLDRAIRAITAAERAIQSGKASGKDSGKDSDSSLFTKIIKEIGMQNETDWSRKYYSDEAKAKVDERQKQWSPELQEKVTKDWNDLYRDIEASLKEDPASAKAQALAARWKKLLEGFTGGDPEVQKGLNKMWADQGNWPSNMKQYQVQPEIQDFIVKAMKIAKP